MNARRAFTLVEVLLAVALTAIVLVAVTSAINLYARLSTAGRIEAERAQLAQSILRRIERDLRSVVYVQPKVAEGSSAASTGQAADQTGTGTTGTASGGTQGATGADASAASGDTTGDSAAAPGTVDTASAYATSTSGLFGDLSTLVVHVSRPSRDLSYGNLFNGDAAGSRTSDLMSVSWFLAVANGTGLQGAVGNLAAGGSTVSSQESGVQGLARLEGDRMALNFADTQGDTAGLAGGAELLAAEVNLLEFRYFDGAAWYETWDSAAMGGLPKAVEIVIGFAEPETAKDTREAMLERLGVAQMSETYRLVVALPLAPPYVE